MSEQISDPLATRIIAQFRRRMISRRTTAYMLVLALVAIAVPGILRLEIEQDASVSLLPRSGHSAEVYNEYKSKFPADFGALLVLAGNICNDTTWTALAKLSDEIEQIPIVDRVYSLVNAPYVVGKADTVFVDTFSNVVAQNTNEYCDLAGGYQPYHGLLIDKTQSSTAIYVRAKYATNAIQFTRTLRDTLAPHRLELESNGLELLQSGDLRVSEELSSQTAKSSNLIVAVIALMLITSWCLTGSIRVGFLAATTGAAGVLFTFALMGYLGVTKTPINVLMANMLIPLGAAFAIHAHNYVRLSQSFYWGFVPEAALRPFLFATASTAIGFGCTAISHSPDVRDFGLLGVFGIAMCLLMTICVTFPMLVKHRNHTAPLLRVDFPVYLLSKNTTLAILLGLAFISLYGLQRLDVNYGPIDYLPNDNPIRVQIEKVAENYALYSIPVSISSGKSGGVMDVELWRHIKAFVDEQEANIPGLRVAWLYDQVAALGLALTAHKDEPVGFPTSKELLAQMLLLFDPDDTSPYVDFDGDSLVLILQSPFRDADELKKFGAELQRYFKDLDIEVELTGRATNYFRVGKLIAADNLYSLGLGIAAVFVLFLLLLRRARPALIATVVNTLPVLGVLALMGICGVNLDIGTSIVSAIALGLVVDDTGHMMARYHYLQSRGSSHRRSGQRILAEYRSPVTTTSIVIIIGFSAMNLAGLVPFHSFSRLLSATVAYALICDLVLLPSLLRHFDTSQRNA